MAEQRWTIINRPGEHVKIDGPATKGYVDVVSWRCLARAEQAEKLADESKALVEAAEEKVTRAMAVVVTYQIECNEAEAALETAREALWDAWRTVADKLEQILKTEGEDNG